MSRGIEPRSHVALMGEEDYVGLLQNIVAADLLKKHT